MSPKGKGDSGEELGWLRQEIDECDSRLIELLARRFGLVRRVGEYKAANSLPVLDEARENALIADRIRRAAGRDNYRVQDIFRVVLEQSRQFQERSRETPANMRRIESGTASAKCWPVIIGSGLLDKLPSLFDFSHYSAIALFTDDNVNRLYGARAAHALRSTGKKVQIYSVPPGEKAKSLDSAERAYRSLMEYGFDRRAVLCVLGGGVPGDLGGYIAATYLRGIDYIQIPTTLLAQVDSSIGGKVGMNFGGKKNIIGAFCQPRAIITDVELLKTLPPEEMRNGLAEIIKYAVAMDLSLFERLGRRSKDDFSPAGLIEIVERCARLKLGIVEADETERTGQRAILNFGHTAGHALEAARDLEGRHGEAVAFGMAAAARISARLGMIKEDDVSRIEGLVRGYGLPVSCGGVEPGRLLELMRYDKKMSAGELRWVLLRGIGSGATNCPVSDSVVLEALREVCR